MIPLKKVLASTVGRKFIMAGTGLALVGFIILHLVGNLQLLLPDQGAAFNVYGHNFTKLGPLYYILEWCLFGVILLHAALGAILWKKSAEARDQGYAVAETKGGKGTRWNLSSRHMMAIGAVLFIFIVVHVLQFRFSIFTPTEKAIQDGVEMKNLYKLVALDTFSKPGWVLFYVGSMLFLGFHLRHGFWSMFQSVGVMPRPYSNIIYVAGTVFAVLMAVGFIFLPLYLYFNQPQ